jgi:hypothetical protein
MQTPFDPIVKERRVNYCAIDASAIHGHHRWPNREDCRGELTMNLNSFVAGEYIQARTSSVMNVDASEYGGVNISTRNSQYHVFDNSLTLDFMVQMLVESLFEKTYRVGSHTELPDEEFITGLFAKHSMYESFKDDNILTNMLTEVASIPTSKCHDTDFSIRVAIRQPFRRFLELLKQHGQPITVNIAYGDRI